MSIETQIAAGPSLKERTGSVEPPNRWTVLALVALGTFMTTLDTSIVNISLPSIARTFQTPIGGAVEWVIIAYLTVVAATLLTFGRLSDAIGRKPVWKSSRLRRCTGLRCTENRCPSTDRSSG